MKPILPAICLLIPILAGCTSTIPRLRAPPITQTQIRALQTREYDGQDTLRVVKTVLNVMQDDGYIIRFGAADLGLLNGDKALAVYPAVDYSSPFQQLVNRDASAASGLFATLEGTANVSRFGDRVRVRLSLQERLSNKDGEVLAVAPIADGKPYQEFFAKLNKGLFLDNAGL